MARTSNPSRLRTVRTLAMAAVGAVALAAVWHGHLSSAPAAPCAGEPQVVALCESLTSPAAIDGIPAANKAALRSLYENRGFRPIWADKANQAQTEDVLALLRHADEDGLEPSDYRVDASARNARQELLISDAVLRYAHDLRVGRVPADDSDSDIDLPRQNFRITAQLDEALANGKGAAFLASQRPPQPEYGDLRQTLQEYRLLAAQGPWSALPAPSKQWQDDPIYVAKIRDRLTEEGFSVSETEEPNAALSAAIQLFQQRNGLTSDGKLGRKTVAALNISPAQRVSQIVANMERWRWLPRAFENSYIVINVPENELRVVDHGAIVLRSRVVVGRRADPSPILRATVRGLVVNPPWNVPTVIASREILPKLRRDRHYLEKNDMVLKDGPSGDPHGLSINWKAMHGIPYHVQQLAGPKSALGQIKMDMPNRFDVYLHDTPGRQVFQLDERFLSHGCIRVQQIQPLASYVLAGDPDSGLPSIQAMVDAGATQTLPARSPIPVYLLYWTVFRGEDGALNFRPDIYGRDERLIAELNGKRSTRVTLATTACCVG